MAETLPLVAVLSGDLIASTDAGSQPTERAMNRLMRAAAGPQARNAPGNFTRFRGDGWQVLVENQSLALRSSLWLFASLQSVRDLPQTRIAIGIGAMNPLPGGDLSAASGPAFEASGRALDAMSRSDRFAIAGPGVTPLQRAIIALVEEQTGRWTPEQAEAAALYLAPDEPTLKGIAGVLGISTQAVHSRIRGGGAQALRQAVKYWEEDAEQAPC